MSKSNTWEYGMLDLLFKNLDFTGVGDAGGLLQSAAAGSLYFSLHTADPGEGGDQTTSEIGYTGYARVAVARGAGFTRTLNSISPTATVSFPIGTGGAGTATYFGVGTAAAGAGKLLYSGTVTPNIVCGLGVTPELTTATAITED
jgi:hypothetical protein